MGGGEGEGLTMVFPDRREVEMGVTFIKKDGGFLAQVGYASVWAKTQAKAKQALFDELCRESQMDHHVLAVVVRGLTGVVFVSHGKYAGAIIRRPGVLYYGLGFDSKTDAFNALHEQLVMATWDWKKDGCAHPDATEKELKRMKDCYEFYVRNDAARRAGLNSHDAHSYAGRNPDRPELWKDKSYPELRI